MNVFLELIFKAEPLSEYFTDIVSNGFNEKGLDRAISKFLKLFFNKIIGLEYVVSCLQRLSEYNKLDGRLVEIVEALLRSTERSVLSKRQEYLFQVLKAMSREDFSVNLTESLLPFVDIMGGRDKAVLVGYLNESKESLVREIAKRSKRALAALKREAEVSVYRIGPVNHIEEIFFLLSLKDLNGLLRKELLKHVEACLGFGPLGLADLSDEKKQELADGLMRDSIEYSQSSSMEAIGIGKASVLRVLVEADMLSGDHFTKKVVERAVALLFCNIHMPGTADLTKLAELVAITFLALAKKGEAQTQLVVNALMEVLGDSPQASNDWLELQANVSGLLGMLVSAGLIQSRETAKSIVDRLVNLLVQKEYQYTMYPMWLDVQRVVFHALGEFANEGPAGTSSLVVGRLMKLLEENPGDVKWFSMQAEISAALEFVAQKVEVEGPEIADALLKLLPAKPEVDRWAMVQFCAARLFNKLAEQDLVIEVQMEQAVELKIFAILEEDFS